MTSGARPGVLPSKFLSGLFLRLCGKSSLHAFVRVGWLGGPFSTGLASGDYVAIERLGKNLGNRSLWSRLGIGDQQNQLLTEP